MQWNENVNKRDGTHKQLDEFIEEVAEGVETVLTPDTEVVDGQNVMTLEEFVEEKITSGVRIWSSSSSLIDMADAVFNSAPQGIVSGLIDASGLHYFSGYIYSDREYGAIEIFDAWGNYGRYRREGSTTTVSF